MDFYSWVTRQVDRDDPVGDLAMDISGDSECPTSSSSLSEWAQYLRSRNACIEAMNALVTAFKEFSEVRQ